MNRKEIIDALATKTGSTKADARRNYDAFMEIGTANIELKTKARMNRKELIDAHATKTGSTKADARRNIDAIIEIISASAMLKFKPSKVPAFKAGATRTD